MFQMKYRPHNFYKLLITDNRGDIGPSHGTRKHYLYFINCNDVGSRKSIEKEKLFLLSQGNGMVRKQRGTAISMGSLTR